MKDHQEGHAPPEMDEGRAKPACTIHSLAEWRARRPAAPTGTTGRPRSGARGGRPRPGGGRVPGVYAPGYRGAPSYGYGGRYGGLGPYSNYGGYGGYAGSGAYGRPGSTVRGAGGEAVTGTGGLGPRSKARRSSRVIHMHGVSASRGPRWLRRGAFWLAAFGLVVLLIVWLRGLPPLSTLFHAIFAPLRP